MNKLQQNEYEREISKPKNQLLVKDTEIKELHKVIDWKVAELIELRKKVRTIPLYTMDNYVEKTQENTNGSKNNKAGKTS